MWADFGQGKTHALLHLATSLNVAQNSLVHYVQLPSLTVSSPFVALYRQVMQDFPLERLGKLVFEHYRSNVHDIFRRPLPGAQPIHQLLWLVGTSAPGKDIAARWLRGDRVTSRETADLVIAGKKLSVGPSPQSAQDALNALDYLIGAAIAFAGKDDGKVVLLLDEFQRVGELTPRRRTEVCDSLHLLFNRHPQGFHLVLAFAGGLPRIVDSVLTNDLQARVSTRLHLPPMSSGQARDYLKELVSSSGGPFPYEVGAIEYIVESIGLGEVISPRKLNVAAGVLTNEVLTHREETGASVDVPIGVGELQAAYAARLEELMLSLGAAD